MWLLDVVFAATRSHALTIAKRRQEASRDHPQQEMRPEIPSAKLSPARQQSTHLRYLLLVATLRNILRPNTNTYAVTAAGMRSQAGEKRLKKERTRKKCS
jgi:hypothetical protein